MEQRDQGDEREEDALVTATEITPELPDPQHGRLLWLRNHGHCNGGAEDATE